jgi:hypothetical protein
MPKTRLQNELGGEVGQVFNLISERGIDPERAIRERSEAEAAAAAAREFELKMQRTFAQCPGFIGGDAPSGEHGKGCVVVEPAMAREARDWLKRRFQINETLELSDQGLCIEIAPRVRRVRGPNRPAITFAKPEQFTLPI